MKKTNKSITFFVLFLSFIMTASLFVSMQSLAAGSVDIYRLNNKSSGEYLYTSDKNEATVLSTQYGWTNEGVAWSAPQTGTPVYRLYHPSGLHLYTMDANEIKTLTTTGGWQSDNNGNALFYSGGKYDVYRAYNSKTKRHFLTSNKSEYDAVVASGWNAENVAMKAETAVINQVVNLTPAPIVQPPSTLSQNTSADGLVHVAVAGAKYVLNTNSYKIHYPSCRDVPKISPENIAGFNGTFQEASNAGYTSCGHCNSK